MSVLVLVGSGEFTPAMKEVDKHLLSLLPPKAAVAIVPTAAGQEADYSKWIKRGIVHFKALGAAPYGVHLVERGLTSHKDYLDKLKDADFIYFSGGNPGYLLSVISGSAVEKLIRRRLKDKNFILAGCSAGAMVMSQYVPVNIFAMRHSDDIPVWQKALGLAPYTVIPHYDYMLREETELLRRLLANMPAEANRTLLGIDEDTAIIIKDKWQIVGKGKIHLLTKQETYMAGQTIDPL